VTSGTPYLQNLGIVDARGIFQKKFVKSSLSGGNYLFDYVNSGETDHYRQILQMISKHIVFEDMSQAAQKGVKAVKLLEGKHAFFVGGVSSKQPDFPIKNNSKPETMKYRKRRIRIEWIMDNDWWSSTSAIMRQGSTNRYIIYCLIRTVETQKVTGLTMVKASPYFVAQPSEYVHRTPAIAHLKSAASIDVADEIDDHWLDFDD